DMAREGMFNIGELARSHYSKKEVVLVGFGSYTGSVVAGRRWGAPMQQMEMPPAKEGSWEHLLHEASNAKNKLLIMNSFQDNMFMENYIGHRAIRVVYNPEHERRGNYVPSILPDRYDAFIYLDTTKALRPLHITPDGHQMPETYPFGV